ncbi:MAG: alpha/beta hydrolase [Myxococcales bacterium]|nr:alpha/beta hydrolase [Myxococcales bacterium]
MPHVESNGIELFYESFGEGVPILLTMGLGAQMTLWRTDFCTQLAERGYRVIRFDNRDIGLSTKLNDLDTGPFLRSVIPAFFSDRIEPPYRLRDMAADMVGLMDALGLDSAHIVGASMGGMICQELAIRHPSRVRSLTSVMSSNGQRRHLKSDPRVLRYLLTRVEPERDKIVEHGVRTLRAVHGDFPFPEEEIRALLESNYDRAFDPRGYVRQLMAVVTARSRVPGLRQLRMPCGVIHGTADRLVLPSAGRATAKAIPEAELFMLEGMGHALPRELWSVIHSAISKTVERGEERPLQPVHRAVGG